MKYAFNTTTLCSRSILLTFFIFIIGNLQLTAQINGEANNTTNDHQKEVIGYFTQWDAWKGTGNNLPINGVYNQLNLDYSQYTILNYSFFGVAKDGSLHSADLKNPAINNANEEQDPGEVLHPDVYSSWDYYLLFGELDLKLSIDATATAQGFIAQGNGWHNTGWNISGDFPIPCKKSNGRKGLLELGEENGVEILASIGGATMSKHFPTIAADPIKRARFIEDINKLMALGFDGIDINWIYPGRGGLNFQGTQADYHNFTLLIQDVRAAIGQDKLLTAAFNSNAGQDPFEWNLLSRSIDFFNMQTFDINGSFSEKTGHNSPLHNYKSDQNISLETSFNLMTGAGVFSEKIILGIPFYGAGIKTNGNAALGRPVIGADTDTFAAWDGRPFIGPISYIYDTWSKHWDNTAKVPYYTRSNYFLSIEDTTSTKEKALFVNQNDGGGVIISPVWGDLDFSEVRTIYGSKLRFCLETKSPFVNKINQTFSEYFEPGLFFQSLEDGEVIYTSTLKPIEVILSAFDQSGIEKQVVTTVDTQEFSGTHFSWTPSSYGSYTLSATNSNGESETKQITIVFKQLITQQKYDEIFPNRFGVNQILPGEDFFSYANFLEAINRMANIKVVFERRATTNLYRLTRIDKTTNSSTIIRADTNFDATENLSKNIVRQEVDYGTFINEGDSTIRKRELAAFFANISQETTGGWDTAPGGRYAWGLYFRQEVGYENGQIGYVDNTSTVYPPVAGKSYHGRGPIQLSWNYNYGAASEFLYGDKTILLNEPEKVIEDGALAFQTAIWFWMTPQFPKPSAHDVMVGDWLPTTYDTQNNRLPGFGVTVNIINGGLECGSGTEIPKVQYRIGHYQRHSEILDVTTDLNGQNDCNACGCKDQTPFGGIEPEPISAARKTTNSNTEEESFIDQESESTELVVFPNPFTDILKLTTVNEITKMVLFTNDGLFIKELPIQTIIDFSNLSSGTYLLKIMIGEEVVTKQIIKQ
ncbi:T9SS type A sorting domain-containing protein [Flammeovirga pectinis]|uniref:T9SS type A sorting domain-containing protein n=1 Tax=Flammeovirga pectinis TaxID=2494373 RepID=A0A3Q9FJZ7_9BACT|nr:glycoside hydrolase family 19 protein [Flammeovirga pectinis]AZQ61401.1 T9SS type A sorting domain-containing protein [Flammeovirga pectinis]